MALIGIEWGMALPVCPRCGASQIRLTLKTTYGDYYYCEGCRNAWHDERLLDARRDAAPMKTRGGASQ